MVGYRSGHSNHCKRFLRERIGLILLDGRELEPGNGVGRCRNSSVGDGRAAAAEAFRERIDGNVCRVLHSGGRFAAVVSYQIEDAAGGSVALVLDLVGIGDRCSTEKRDLVSFRPDYAVVLGHRGLGWSVEAFKTGYKFCVRLLYGTFWSGFLLAGNGQCDANRQ